MTIQEQLNEIKTEKENIKTVLINKGIDLTGVPFTEYHNVLKAYNLQIPIETTLTSTVNNTSIHYGATVTISGTISATDSTILSGQTVTLYNDTTSVGTATIDSTGAYSLTYIVQTMTSPNLTVKYAGKGLYTASTSEVPVLTISKADTVLTLTGDKTSASTGETVTLTATLVDINGNPVSGATINFMEGNTTLYSGLTTNGSVSYNYSSSTQSTKSLKCVFSGNIDYNASNSNNMTLIITNTIFEDNCSTNKYNSYMNINNCSCTVTYQNSTDGYRVDPCFDGSLLSPVAVADLPKNNFELSVKIKKTTGNYGYHGIGVLNGTTNQILLQGYLVAGSGHTAGLFIEGNIKTDYNIGVATNLNTWYTFKLRVQNNSLTLYLLDEAGTSTLWSKNYGTISFDRYGVWIRRSYAYFKDYKLILL